MADTYRKSSLKDPETKQKCTSAKVIVQPAQSKIPRNFSEFLKNGENKTGIIELIKDVLIANKEDVLINFKLSVHVFLNGQNMLPHYSIYS